MSRLPPVLAAYLDVLQTLPDAAIVVTEQVVVFANARAETLLGFGPGGLDGRPLVEISDEPAAWIGDATPGEGGRAGLRLRRADGRIVVADVARRPVLLDGRGLAVAILRVEAGGRGTGDAARTSEELLRQAVLVAHLGIFDHDQVRDAIYWSPEQRAIHGWGVDQPITLADFATQVHPDDRAWVAELVARAHDPAGDGKWDVEHRIVRPDGQVRWLLGRSQTFFGERDGVRRPVRTVGAVADITEQRAAADALAMFRTSIDQASDAVYWLDADGRFTYVNDEACRSLGYTRQEMACLHLWDIDTSYLPAAWAARWRDFEWTRHPVVQRIETRHRRKDGTAFPVEVIAQHLPLGEGALHVAYVRDITDRQRLEAQLLQAQKMESVGRLAGGVAHDFNNLLTAIQGNVSLALLDVPPGDPVRQSLEEAMVASESAAKLTRQLLAFARNEVIRPQVLDLNEVVGRLASMLRRLLGEDVDLRLDLDPAIGRVRVDRGQMEQVIVNIAVNARDALPDGGRLTIATAPATLDGDRALTSAGAHVMLAMSDDGTGMTAEVRGHLFEPFYTTKEVGKGTGLGLAMVYGAIKMNGGSIEVESEPGAGTTFRIFLPVANEVSEATPVQPSGTLAAGAETIALVEDETQVRALAFQILRRQGYQVLAYPNGDQALAAIAAMSEPIHLLVTDVVLPGMNGQVLARRVRELRPGMRVLYTSGYTRDVILDHGVVDEGIDFLAKPYTIDQLARRVRLLLDAPR